MSDANGWTTNVGQTGSYFGYTAYVVSATGKKIPVAFCCKSEEEAQERAKQALPVWAEFHAEAVSI